MESKIDKKGCWKNDAKTMTTKIVKKSNMDDHGLEKNSMLEPGEK